MIGPRGLGLIDEGVIELLSDGRVKLTRAAWQAATRGTRYEERGLYHFVGFKDDRYLTAINVFGQPDFIHRFGTAERLTR